MSGAVLREKLGLAIHIFIVFANVLITYFLWASFYSKPLVTIIGINTMSQEETVIIRGFCSMYCVAEDMRRNQYHSLSLCSEYSVLSFNNEKPTITEKSKFPFLPILFAIAGGMSLFSLDNLLQMYKAYCHHQRFAIRDDNFSTPSGFIWILSGDSILSLIFL